MILHRVVQNAAKCLVNLIFKHALVVHSVNDIKVVKHCSIVMCSTIIVEMSSSDRAVRDDDD